MEAIVTGHTARTPQRFVGAAPQSTRRPRRAHFVASSSEMSRWAIIDAASVERLPTPRSHDARRQLCGQSERSSIRGARAASEMRCHDERLSMDSREGQCDACPVVRVVMGDRRDGIRRSSRSKSERLSTTGAQCRSHMSRFYNVKSDSRIRTLLVADTASSVDPTLSDAVRTRCDFGSRS